MFEDLSLKIENALKKVRGQGRLNEKNISDTLREIRRILLDADVNYKVAKEFIDKVSEKALGKEVIASITPGQLITKIIFDELVTLLGSSQTEIKLNPSGTTVIMVVGLQGSGKTTFCAKLAKRLKDHKRKVLLAAADVYRPAAIEQLKQLGEKNARGGAALSIRSVVGKPIKFISNGEKTDALEAFYPDRLASRILGKGDVISLVEKAQENFDDKEAQRMEEKLRKNQFDFDDFLKQIKVIKKMGSLSSLLGMIPGLNAQIKNAQVDDNALVKVEAIINSMTRIERGNPKILNGSRRKRIARGSGTSVQDVNKLLKQFEEMKKMMSRFSGKSSFANLSMGR
ncbi:MAG: ffh [Ignavibacteriaceae bacterium]|nr:ffh [Ignavibacteriaceae bacterium]